MNVLHKKYDFIIVGAGIVGLSFAYTLIKRYPEKKILILEKENFIFKHQSGRNSGVIHSGVYYKPGSKKAINCINGYKKLIRFSKTNKIDFEITGKIIIATNKKEYSTLEKLYENGIKNGLKDLKILNKDEIIKIEPYCTNATKALFVPQAGIINYLQLGETLKSIIVKKKGEVHFGKEVKKITNNGKYVHVTLKSKIIKAEKVVVCSGVHSDKFLNDEIIREIRIFPFKGEYYKIKDSAKHKINGLIYPVPNIKFPFLGVHLTKNIYGGIDAGPNAVLSFDKEGYKKLSFNFKDFYKIISWKGFWILSFKFWRIGLYEIFRSFSKKKFAKSLQNLIPSLKVSDLEVSRPGIRAQAISFNGELIDDFLINKNGGILNVINAPSPAATSCFSIADEILKNLEK